MPEDITKKSSRDTFMERMKTRHPDTEYADDDALFNQIGADYDELDGKAKRFDEMNKTFTNLIVKHPNSARFMSAWERSEDGDPIPEFVRMYGETFADALKDPKELEKIAQINKERAEDVAKEAEYDKMYKENVVKSKANFKNVFERLGVTSEEEKEMVYGLLQKIVNDAILGSFEEEIIESAVKAVRHDGDVNNAKTEGVVKGRNAKIVEKERKSKKGDGISAMPGGAGVMMQKQPTPMNNYTGGSIFDRGGEKRTKYRR